MRGTRFILSSASAALLFALAIAGCKYSSTAPPLPGPSLAPTLPPGVVSEAAIPTAAATPLGIATGPDGNVWFAELNGNRIGRIIPATLAITECPVPTSGSQPVDVTSASGNPKVWFDEFSGNKIGSVDPSTCGVSEFPIPSSSSEPLGLTSDQNGVLWFAEFQVAAPKIAKMTVGGSFTEYPVPFTNSQPSGVVIANDNTVWFLDSGTNAIGHLTFSGGNPVFAEYAIPSSPSNPQFIVVGPDSNLWFTEIGNPPLFGSRIGKLTIGASPTITEYVVPSEPFPDGAFVIGITNAGGFLWFGEADTGQIGRITTGGVVTEYGIPGSGTTAVGVSRGPDGNVWFTDGGLDNNPQQPLIGTNQVGVVKIGMIPASSVRKTFKAMSFTQVARPVELPHHGVYTHRRVH